MSATALKVAFIQKVLMHLSFLQTDKPYYFLELKICGILKGSNHIKLEPKATLKALFESSEPLQALI